MLSKKERLSRKEFSRFFSMGRRTHTTLFQIVYTHHNTLHVSVVLSKKFVRSAVLRNKIRRRIYDIVRQHRKTTGVVGVYIIIIKSSTIHQKTYQELKKEVIDCIQKINT